MTQYNQTQSGQSRMILIDDDPTYCAIMRKIAAKKNINLDIFQSIIDVSGASNDLLGAYTAAIIDYDLGQVNGVEITGYLGSLLGDVPVILVSSTDRSADLQRSQDKIQCFINKSKGFERILDEAEFASHGVSNAA